MFQLSTFFVIVSVFLSTMFRNTLPLRALLKRPDTISRLFRRHMSSEISKNFLDVPFESKDEAKILGAKWDSEAKKWFIPEGLDTKPFDKFLKVYLTVPFAEKDEVKSLGGRWDKEKLKWYVPPGKDVALFAKWVDSKGKVGEKGGISPPKTAFSRPSITSNGISTHTAAPLSYSSKPKSAISNDPRVNIVFLSIDTNGLPMQENGAYLPYDNLASYDSSRMIQISYQLCKLSDLSPISGNTFTILSDGFPIDNSEYHNITLETSKASGTPFPKAAETVFDAIDKANYVCAHNADFVYNIFRSELFRHGMLDLLNSFEGKRKLCSMIKTEKLLDLKDKRGKVKKPSLKELVQATSGEDLPNVRNSKANVEYLRKALQILVNTGRLSLAQD
jgi:hypothetical protein